MMRPFLTIHRWLGICLGLILFTWIVSGIVMILPGQPVVPPQFNSPGGLASATLAPAAAGALIPGDASTPRTVRLVGIGGRPFYRVKLEGGERFLLDASSGTILTITPQVAESLARMAVGAGEETVVSVQEIRGEPRGDVSGPLYAFRVSFEDPRRTVARVSLSDGSVAAETRLQRFRMGISGLHTFQPIGRLTDRPFVRRGALHISGAVGILLVLSGYYLALPMRWRRRQTENPTSKR